MASTFLFNALSIATMRNHIFIANVPEINVGRKLASVQETQERKDLLPQCVHEVLEKDTCLVFVRTISAENN